MSEDDKTRAPGDAPNDDQTVFVPAVPEPPQPAPADAARTIVTSVAASPAAPPRAAAQHVQIGDVLNHIFEVRKFIARGGMGEVFEGVNISSDERVAIKVMLPALSADPHVQAMFRREASTLRRLQHPALVHYQILAEEPSLKLLYIVTEFIEGPSLADLLGQRRLGVEELRKLGLRLAEGLGVAHRLGAVHRDISPDNILLEDGRLENAKIIDFGIAKDTGGKKETIIGDGFAGKLNFVAPEQLGAYDRQVGPWTDIYSLGLVLLAGAKGGNVDMGATLFEAVERRRTDVDLSDAPAELRPALTAMLHSDPAQRLRSMEDVIAALGDSGWSEPAPARPEPPEPERTIYAPPPSFVVESKPNRMPLIIGGVIALLLVLGGLGYMLMSPPAPTGGEVATGTGTAAPGEGPSADDPRVLVNQVVPTIGCTWLEVGPLDRTGQTVTLGMKGVAQAPARAQAKITSALADGGLQASDINFDQVATVPASLCPVLDAFQSIRKAASTNLDVLRPSFEIMPQADGTNYAKVMTNIDVGAGSEGIAFFGLTDQGVVFPVTDPDKRPIATREAMLAFLAASIKEGLVTKVGPTEYRVEVNPDQAGWSGLLMLTGREPFDVALITTPPAQRNALWKERFAAAAARGEWQAEMVWFNVTDNVPN